MHDFKLVCLYDGPNALFDAFGSQLGADEDERTHISTFDMKNGNTLVGTACVNVNSKASRLEFIARVASFFNVSRLSAVDQIIHSVRAYRLQQELNRVLATV